MRSLIAPTWAKLDLEEKVALLTGAGYWPFRAHPGIGLRALTRPSAAPLDSY